MRRRRVARTVVTRRKRRRGPHRCVDRSTAKAFPSDRGTVFPQSLNKAATGGVARATPPETSLKGSVPGPVRHRGLAGRVARSHARALALRLQIRWARSPAAGCTQRPRGAASIASRCATKPAQSPAPLASRQNRRSLARRRMSRHRRPDRRQELACTDPWIVDDASRYMMAFEAFHHERQNALLTLLVRPCASTAPLTPCIWTMKPPQLAAGRRPTPTYGEPPSCSGNRSRASARRPALPDSGVRQQFAFAQRALLKPGTSWRIRRCGAGHRGTARRRGGLRPSRSGAFSPLRCGCSSG